MRESDGLELGQTVAVIRHRWLALSPPKHIRSAHKSKGRRRHVPKSNVI
jgi:hypothetical protein